MRADKNHANKTREILNVSEQMPADKNNEPDEAIPIEILGLSQMNADSEYLFLAKLSDGKQKLLTRMEANVIFSIKFLIAK